MVSRLLEHKVVEDVDMAADVNQATGRQQVEHKRAAFREKLIIV